MFTNHPIQSNFGTYEGALAIICALVRQAGGEVTITQEELDANVGLSVLERSQDGVLSLKTQAAQ